MDRKEAREGSGEQRCEVYNELDGKVFNNGRT